MRFVDYKCNDCGVVSEVILRSDNNCEVMCEKCKSKNVSRIFFPVGLKSSSSSKDSNFSSSTSSRNCSGSCASCSGGCK